MSKPVKRLLSAAVNDYPNGIGDLNGCLNDQLLTYKIWKEVYGFTEFKLLSNNEATRINIKQGLNWLVSDLPPDSTICFLWSGHGTSIPTNSETQDSEADSMDETIVNYDFNPRDPIRDNELGAQFKNIDPSIHILVIEDACMSGTGLRGCLPHNAKNRYFRPLPSVMLENGGLELDDDLSYLIPKIKSRDIARKPFLIKTMEQGNAILISGCAEHEYSADALFNNRFHGALTFFLAQTLKEHTWNITYENLVVEINKKLDEAGFTEQTPQCECSDCFNKLFMGGKK